MIDFLGTYLPEFFYVLCGLVSFDTAYRATKNEEARIGTSLFWFLLGVIFTFGKIIPSVGVGVLLVLMGCLTVLKQVKMGSFVESTPEFRKKASERVGNKIFIPAVAIGVVALLLSFIQYSSDGIYFVFRQVVIKLTSDGEGWMCFGLYDSSRELTLDGAGLTWEWNSEVGTAPWLMLSL